MSKQTRSLEFGVQGSMVAGREPNSPYLSKMMEVCLSALVSNLSYHFPSPSMPLRSYIQRREGVGPGRAEMWDRVFQSCVCSYRCVPALLGALSVTDRLPCHPGLLQLPPSYRWGS